MTNVRGPRNLPFLSALMGASSADGTPARWFRPHTVVMAIIFLSALIIGYYVLPGTNERIAALERDGKFEEALRILEQQFERGDRSQRTLFQLQRFYEHFGDLGKARKTLEMLAELRPADPRVQRQLVQFYKQTQDERGYVETLTKQLGARYSEPICRELIGIHRRNGAYQAEQETLETCRNRGYRRPDDIIRLAYLVAADGELARASDLLRTVDDRRRLKVDRDRLMFFTALLEANRAEEAQKRALRWLKGSKDDALVLLLIDNLAKENRYDLAIDLARNVGTPGDGVSLAVAELMLDRNETNAARVYLKGWLDSARLRDPDVVQRFVSASLDAEDPEMAFHAAEAYGLERLGQGELVALAEALSAIGVADKFAKVRQSLDPVSLRDNPLLAAAIELDRGASGPARQLLSQVPVDSLDEWRLALWARLMETAGRRTTSAQALRELGIEPGPAAAPQRIIRRTKAPTPAAAGAKGVRPPQARRKLRGPPVAQQGAPAQQAPPVQQFLQQSN